MLCFSLRNTNCFIPAIVWFCQFFHKDASFLESLPHITDNLHSAETQEQIFYQINSEHIHAGKPSVCVLFLPGCETTTFERHQTTNTWLLSSGRFVVHMLAYLSFTCETCACETWKWRYETQKNKNPNTLNHLTYEWMDVHNNSVNVHLQKLQDQVDAFMMFLP